MARSTITSKTKDLISDDGSVLVSLIKGEQTQISVTINWLTSLSGCIITPKVVEANNTNYPTLPTQVHQSNPNIRLLEILYNSGSGLAVDTNASTSGSANNSNTFSLVFPEDLITQGGSAAAGQGDYNVQPDINKSVYGFLGVEIKDTGVGALQQIYKPFRGLVEVRFSPTEV
jgi:hypothetical protein